MVATFATIAPATARASPPAMRAAVVRIVDLRFAPSTIRVRRGQPVRWINEDQVPHTVTSGASADDGRWRSSPPIAPGKTFVLVIERAGTYRYFCKPHFYNPAMHATIVVDP